MKPTIKDVAEKANVSVATVSRIVNNKGGYSEETEERVLSVIKEIGYEINAVARSLATKNSYIIGVLLPYASTSVFTEVLNGIEDTAHKHCYSVIYCNTGNNGVRAFEYLKVLSANQVAGLIYTSSPLFDHCYELIRKINIPSVLALTVSYKYQVPFVKVDDRQAAYAAISYLIRNGHKKIALITGTKDDIISTKPRTEAYIQALTDYGIKVDNNLIVNGNFTFESGAICMKQLLDSKGKFTAVFAESDDMAVGAINVAHQRGIRVPEDISFIGYDNTKISTMCIPNLTTISQPQFEIGQRAAENLFRMIKGEKVQSIIMPYEIIERDTVKKIE